MKTRAFGIVAVAAFALTALAAPAAAATPADKATGTLHITNMGGQPITMTLTVQEAQGTRPVKGTVTWDYDDGRYIHMNVVSANIVGNTATFVGQVYEAGGSAGFATLPGVFWGFQVTDAGSSAAAGDTLAWTKSFSATNPTLDTTLWDLTGGASEIQSGNLTVLSY